MKLRIFLALLLNSIVTVFAQSTTNTELDSLYREDQIYVGVTYNALVNLPNGGFSKQFFNRLTFWSIIRDFPINKRRNVAIGLGFGYSFNIFNQNIKISSSTPTTYTILDGIDYSKNNFSQHLLEVPLEFRWRTSNAETYKFWRIYTGVKLGYAIASKSIYKGEPV